MEPILADETTPKENPVAQADSSHNVDVAPQLNDSKMERKGRPNEKHQVNTGAPQLRQRKTRPDPVEQTDDSNHAPHHASHQETQTQFASKWWNSMHGLEARQVTDDTRSVDAPQTTHINSPWWSTSSSSSSSSDKAQAQSLPPPFAAESRTNGHSTSTNYSSQEAETDEKFCRICFDSVSTEETGRLFSPCKCKGSMKYVHTNCLDAWRHSSKKHSSWIKCDFCGYEYHIRRTKWAKVFSSKITISILTITVFSFITFLSGFLTKYLIRNVFISQSDPLIHSEADDELELLLHDPELLSYTSFDFAHYILGLITVGIVGCFSLVLSLLHTPLGPGRFHLRTGFQRDTAGFVILGIIIAIGVIKALINVYTIVKALCERGLKRVEGAILDVGNGPNVKVDAPGRRESAAPRVEPDDPNIGNEREEHLVNEQQGVRDNEHVVPRVEQEILLPNDGED